MFVFAVAWFAECFAKFCKYGGQGEEHDGREHDGCACGNIKVIAKK
jgi:hypothetical protein